jgi:S1-C subfamily serine protease
VGYPAHMVRFLRLRRSTSPLVVLGALLLPCLLLPCDMAGAADAPRGPVVAPPAAPPVAPTAVPPVPTTAPARSPEPTVTDAAAEKALAFAREVDDALVKAVGSVSESSVTVWNLQRPKAEEGVPPSAPVRVGGGSGVLVTIKGKGPFIISNEHVVKGADRLEVAMHDGTMWEVTLKDHVPTYDIALLEFGKDRPRTWKAARLGKSEALVEGQWVIATGNPFFLGGDGCCVATFGVISGLDRTVGGEFMYANAIQHDAEVNPGNSGGPLWNLAGELVGINGLISSRGGGTTLGASNTGASFAIPIHLIKRYFDDLLSDKVSAAAGYLGLDLEDDRDGSGKPTGVKVLGVRNDSPVRKADAKTNPPAKDDVITQISFGTSVTMKPFSVFSSSDLTNALALYPAGTKVRIAYTRGRQKLSWTGDLGSAPKSEPPPPRSGGRK